MYSRAIIIKKPVDQKVNIFFYRSSSKQSQYRFRVTRSTNEIALIIYFGRVYLLFLEPDNIILHHI